MRRITDLHYLPKNQIVLLLCQFVLRIPQFFVKLLPEFFLDGFKVDSKTYSPIGGTLKEEKFAGKHYDKIAKKQVRKEASRYIINFQVSSKEFK